MRAGGLKSEAGPNLSGNACVVLENRERFWVENFGERVALIFR